MLSTALLVAFLLSTIMLLVSLAGVIYPFKPLFQRRKQALASAGGAIILGFAIVFSSAFIDLGSSRASWKDNRAITTSSSEAAEEEVKQASLPVPSEPEEQAQATGSQPADEPAAITQEAEPNESKRSTNKQIAELRNHIDMLRWKQAGYVVTVWRNKAYEIEDIVSELENEVLSIVKPLPASDHEMNLKGYELLAALRPDNPAYAQKVEHYASRKEEAERQAIARLRKKEDKVENVTWYQHPNQPRYLNSRSTVYLYIGRKGEHGSPWLRMKTVYASSNWLFVDNVIAWHDGIREPLVSGHFKRDNNSRIWEWRDDSPTGYQIEVLKSLADAKEAILRFEGAQYRKDVTLSAADKKAIREVLLAYEIMKRGL